MNYLNHQPNKEHYRFSNYVNIERWSSYYYQIKEAQNLQPSSALVIGIGDGIVIDVLRKQGITVYTLDFDKELQPDFCGSVSELDTIMGNLKVDLIVCCQVLEHLPYDFFVSILKAMKKHARNVIISLPYSNRHILKYSIKVPYIRFLCGDMRISTFWKSWESVDSSGHHWEIGYKNYSLKRIKKDIRQVFKIEKIYCPIENTYHLFFRLT
jgi:hypothetical protein